MASIKLGSNGEITEDTQIQFTSEERVYQLRAEIERLRAEVEWHEEENSKLRGLLHDAMGAIWCWEPTSQSGKELKQKLSDNISAALREKE